MQWLMIPLVIIAGALNGAQAGANSTLSKSLGNPIASALVVYSAGLITFAVLAPFFGFQFSSLGKLRQTPWWAMIGGVGGALFIVSMLVAAPKLGTGAFTGLTITAALVVTILIDNYGWLGVARHPAGLARIAGATLMIAGIALVAKF